MTFTVYPAVDISGGRAVRLWQGERSRLRQVHEDPVALAARLVDEGASFLHVVDLDGAFGDGANDDVLRRLLAAVPIPVQVGGGVRSEERFFELRNAGAARCVLGTSAVRDPDLVALLCQRDPEAVVVAADTRGGKVASEGWTRTEGGEIEEVAAAMRGSGVRHLLVTAVERDGTSRGPDHRVLERAMVAFGPGVIASGGVGSVMDVVELAALAARGLAGVVVGSLLVDGKAKVDELLAVTEGW